MAAGKLVLFLLFLLHALGALAQTDTSQTQLREVEVKASRARYFAAGNRSVRASALDLKVKQHATLPELLRQLSAVYVKNYGPGNLASLSVRGTTANQAALVWNGIQINAATNGLADLNLVQVGSVQSVTLIPGPMSALYGSGAVGGTLFLDSAPSADSVHSIRVSQTAGSFGAYQSRLQGTYGSARWQGRTSYSYTSARNNFPFRNTYLPGSPMQRTPNAGLRQHNLTHDLFFYPSVRYSVSVHGWHYATQRQIPPVMGVPESRAKQTDKVLRLAAVVKRASSIGSTTLRTAFLSDYLLYQNPQIYSAMPKPARTVTWLTEAEQQFVFRKLILNAGLSVRAVNGKIADYGRTVNQSQQAVFLSARQQFGPGTTLVLNGRKEFVAGFDPEPTASVGAEQVLGRFSGVKLKAQAANSFRVPTLNERYWMPGGNPSLKPEKGVSAEAGLSWSAEKKSNPLRSVELTGYTSRLTDMILWKQVSAFVFSPENVTQVWARGAEASLELYGKLLRGKKLSARLRATYAFTRSTQQKAEVPAFAGNQLIYIPQHAATLFAVAETPYLNLGWQQSWQSAVFTSADNRGQLPGFALSDLLIWSPEFSLSTLHTSVQASMKNVFDLHYQTILNIPMPGRSFEISLNLTVPYSTQKHAPF